MFAQWVWSLGGSLWACEGAAQALHRNLDDERPKHSIETCLVSSWQPSALVWVAFPWPASLLEGMTHISVPRSDNLANLRAASSTRCCSRTLPAERGRGFLQRLCCCRPLPGTAVWCCLSWLLSPQPLLICQKYKYSRLGFRSQTCLKAKENASAMCKSLASLTAVWALTSLSKVYKTSSIPIFFIWMELGFRGVRGQLLALY